MQSRVLLFVFITVLLDMVGFGIVIPLLPFYVQTMGGSAEVIGLLLGTFALTQTVATPLLGRLSDRFGRRPVILASLAGNAVAMVIFAIAAEQAWLALLFFSRILAGATAGNLAACQAAVADVTTGADRAGGMGRVGAGIGLGLVIGPILGSTVSHLHPNAPPLVAALLAVLDLIGVYFFMPETRAVRTDASGASAASPRSLRRALLDPAIVSVMASYFLTFICMTNVQVSLALLADERLHWTATEVGHLFGLYGLMALVMQGAIGRLSKRFPGVTLLIGGTSAIGLGMAAIGAAHASWVLMIGVALAGLGAGLTNPTLASLASQHASVDQQGAVLGFAQSAGAAARTVGPVWSGFLFARLGSTAPFASGVLAALLSLAVALALRRRLTRAHAGNREAA